MSTSAAGPVWVKGSIQLPPDDNDYPLLIDMGDVDMYGVGHWDKKDKVFRNAAMGRLGHPRDKVCWLLDESAEGQLFTREQVASILVDVVQFTSGNDLSLKGAIEYMNTNFPTPLKPTS